MMFYVEKRSKPAKEGWAATNTSESILISILHFIGLMPWPTCQRKKKRGRRLYVYTLQL